ncbi:MULTISPECIES: alpha/beta fold hydrolase [Streptomyces]|uniref:Alpha/beta hydrolase n=1 Tax=Streptomyces venezuelae TaxID=54571 RepID=A0A5P2BIT1_STRVZ|nr:MULTISPECIES: alpha/beta fold hydrolase [Streptomyces]MYY84464.1 alpha/beta hydrolase [Streptomyces sp. SID335]MYZ19649.1 alpha/beta hydrolase [Streptomyces sp. SID337]NDZ86343.1 alpha/beta fold hydrolase [Streptomyces sp. SID10115]NEB50300.1 alpha/beta fold hydrolase [Streptomyces sp. SID339]QES29031.1 alpha/beta hydrolase [Streptomyces venezuelae]
MAQEGTAGPAGAARLGRAIGTAPSAVGGVVLLLPGGAETSSRRPSPLAGAGVRALGRRLAQDGREAGLVTHVVHYRCRGWNGAQAELARDTNWAADEIVRLYGDVPVCLAGVDMGGRAALRAGGHAAVNSVLAMAPWLPEDDVAAPPEPVKQLAGRRVLIVHGTNDERTDPELSFRFAERAKKANRDVCRFEVHSDGHRLQQHQAEVLALASDFVMGTLFGADFARPLEDALAAPPPLGLRMPLASGFGRSLRR